MPDALTESFCERCGTRYEFAAPEPLTPMRKTRGLISGLKSYILSQDSLSDSIGDAMRSQEELLAAKQLEAFHSAFNFCIDCRQYTCTNCWNDAVGRCQSCQPLPQVEGLARKFETVIGTVQADLNAPMSWPSSDLQEALPATTFELPEAPPVEPEPEEVEAPEPEPVLAEIAPEPEPEPEPIAPERWADLIPTLAEVDPVPAEPMVVAPEPEVEVAAEAEPEPEPEPVAAEVEPEPEPEPVVPEPIPLRPARPISDTFVHYPRPTIAPEPSAAAAAAAEEDREALAARQAQLELLGLGDPGEGPVAPSRPVLLPYRSSGAAAPGSGRLAAASGGRGFWDASAREVADAISQVGVRSCPQCDLSLSATARFCRRCGTPQAA